MTQQASPGAKTSEGGPDTRAIAVAELDAESAPRVDHEFRVFITEDAFDRAVSRGGDNTSVEVGGVLVGVVRRDDAGPYVRVDTTIDALHAEEKGTELTFTHATWEHIHAQMDTEYQDKRVVGWYHTHPGFGIFLSDRDEFIHRSFFDRPFQIALVYDPISRKHGVFTWHQGEPARARRYWIGEHEHVWDGAREDARKKPAADVRPAAPAVAAGHADAGADEPRVPLDWASLVLIALVVLALGGWVGWWLGSRSADDVILRAEAEIARSRAEGAQDAVKSLNVELLDVVRASVSDQATRRYLDQTRAALARAERLLGVSKDEATGVDGAKPAQPGPTAGAPVAGGVRKDVAAELANIRRAAEALASERASLDDALRTVRAAAAANDRAEAEALAVQRTALGSLYADLANAAAKDDKQRAVRYLQIAAMVDPGNYKQYQQLLRKIDGKARLVDPRHRGAPRPGKRRPAGKSAPEPAGKSAPEPAGKSKPEASKTEPAGKSKPAGASKPEASKTEPAGKSKPEAAGASKPEAGEPAAGKPEAGKPATGGEPGAAPGAKK